MPFCAKCGSEVAPSAGFCPKCGAPQSVASQPAGSSVPPAGAYQQPPGYQPPPAGAYIPPPGGAYPPPASPTAGMAENVAGCLCYVLGWITGLIFFLIDKRPFVRFHAAQSIVTFGGLQIISFLLFFLHLGSAFGGVGFFGLAALLHMVIWFLTVILWIVCMVKAYQHQMFRVPIAANFADQLAGKQI